MFPSLGFLIRKSVTQYQFPGTDLMIDEDVAIAIPVQAIQNDPKYFENPEKFIPERFSPENVKDIKPFTYLPFGDGPRACIGKILVIFDHCNGLLA